VSVACCRMWSGGIIWQHLSVPCLSCTVSVYDNRSLNVTSYCDRAHSMCQKGLTYKPSIIVQCMGYHTYGNPYTRELRSCVDIISNLQTPGTETVLGIIFMIRSMWLFEESAVASHKRVFESNGRQVVWVRKHKSIHATLSNRRDNVQKTKDWITRWKSGATGLTDWNSEKRWRVCTSSYALDFKNHDQQLIEILIFSYVVAVCNVSNSTVENTIALRAAAVFSTNKQNIM